jgi:hypothetical protein
LTTGVPVLITGAYRSSCCGSSPNIASGFSGGLSLTGHGVPSRILSFFGGSARSLVERTTAMISPPRLSRQEPHGDTVN